MGAYKLLKEMKAELATLENAKNIWETLFKKNEKSDGKVVNKHQIQG